MSSVAPDSRDGNTMREEAGDSASGCRAWAVSMPEKRVGHTHLTFLPTKGATFLKMLRMSYDG